MLAPGAVECADRSASWNLATESFSGIKVMTLYKYCEERGIPLLTHGGSGGFAVLRKRRLKAYTAISKWEKTLWVLPRLGHPRRKALLRLILDRPNLYVDISCHATKPKYYSRLRRALDRLNEEERATIRERILFGTDFAVSLMMIESYTAYLRLFSESQAITDEERELFCSINPARFLFR